MDGEPKRNNISITFKTPDAVDFATEDLDASEKEAAREALKKWISYGEYVTLSYDPNNDTMTVQKR
jgi:hypothetical protein